MLNPFFLSGSKSTNFNLPATDDHPLPPCPDLPNCIRISKSISHGTDSLWDGVTAALEKMGPTEMDSNRSTYRIDAVFRVFLFKDDFSLQLEARESGSMIHLRSASREGYSDLGVNRRRVKRFLKLLETVIHN